MESIINFENSRRIDNCPNLCYSNSAIYLLYSLVEFREKIYNTDVINPDDSNSKENNALYYLKYIFLLMNKDLTPTHTRYELTDTHIVCKRTRDGNDNSFYKEIYRPYLILTTAEGEDQSISEELKKKVINCSTNPLFIYYFLAGLIKKESKESINILQDLFTQKFGHYYLFHTHLEAPIDNKKYLLIRNNGSPLKLEQTITNKSNQSIKYDLIGTIYSSDPRGGHYWAYIYDKNTNQSLRIDDFGKLINEVAVNTPQYMLYKQVDQSYVDSYPLTQQINNLASISHEINTVGKNRLNKLNHKVILKLIKNKLKQKVCSVCTLINKSNATTCTLCGSNL